MVAATQKSWCNSPRNPDRFELFFLFQDLSSHIWPGAADSTDWFQGNSESSMEPFRLKMLKSIFPGSNTTGGYWKWLNSLPLVPLVLVLLILRDQVVHVGLGFCELHLLGLRGFPGFPGFPGKTWHKTTKDLKLDLLGGFNPSEKMLQTTNQDQPVKIS